MGRVTLSIQLDGVYNRPYKVDTTLHKLGTVILFYLGTKFWFLHAVDFYLVEGTTWKEKLHNAGYEVVEVD